MATSRAANSQPQPVRVHSVKSETPIVVRFLGPIRGLEVHWQRGRSIPCDGLSECPPSLHRTPSFYHGYSAAELWDGSAKVWQPVVLEVTESLEETLRGRELRGEVWALARTTDHGKTSPVVGIYCETLAHEKVSAAFDIVPVLLRVFHVKRIVLGARNPTPPRVMLESVPGDAPNLPAELRPETAKVNTPEELEEAKKMFAKFRERFHGRATAPAEGNGKENGNGKH